MTISGADALRAIDDALADVRREEDDLARRIGRAAERLVRIQGQEAELLQQLPGQSGSARDELLADVAKAEGQAREALREHASLLMAGERKLRNFDSAINEANTRRLRLRTEADSNGDTLSTVTGRIRPALVQNPDFARRAEEARQLASLAGESFRQAALAEADRKVREAAYHADPLFSYLWAAGYGSSEYKANRLVSWLDKQVARVAGFEASREKFATLTTLPDRLREVAEQQARHAAEAAERVRAIETAAIDAAGGKSAREAFESSLAAIAALDRDIVLLEDQRDATAQAQRDVSEGSESALKAAMTNLATALSRPELVSWVRELAMSEAYAPLIDQIADAQLRAREEDEETRELRAQLGVLAARRRELEDIQYEFKRRRYDSPRSSFERDDLGGELLNAFLRGTLSALGYWQQWQDAQRWSLDGPAWPIDVLDSEQGDSSEGPESDPAKGYQPATFSRPRGSMAAGLTAA